MSKYVTTAISYVNGAPHLGHAFELVFADALVRARRSFGEDVRFLTGTDENSLKNVRAAEEERLDTRALVDRNAARFAALASALHISNDDFIRTTETRHVEGVTRLWRACAEHGDFYRSGYRGLYCVGCESFYAAEDLDSGRCPEHGTSPEVVEEENVFFRLSRYRGQIEDAIERGVLRIVPDKAHREALALVRRGLVDFSVSRTRSRARGWGICVPDDPEQIVYVWFDALANYITALGYGRDDALFDRHWRCSEERIHVIGKGITRFHAAYWPGILLSADLPLPTSLVVHGYLTADGKKIGKSSGNAVDPFALVEAFGADVVRYWLLRHVRPTEDADFTLAGLRRARDAELADQLGNLLQRTVQLVAKAFDGAEPPPTSDGGVLLDAAAKLAGEVRSSIDAHRPDRALAALFALVEGANRFIDAQAPWRLLSSGSEDDRGRLGGVLRALLTALSAVGRALEPFLPETGRALSGRLGGVRGRITAGPPLFPKR
jgi:methionyl-tRNA synthetase